MLPLILLISISFDGSSVTNFSLIPKVFTLNAYRMVFATPGRILNGYKVTTFYSVFGTLSSLVVMMMFAYSISRPNFVLRNPLTFILFFTTLFSGGLVPSYLLNTRYLHLNNTIWICTSTAQHDQRVERHRHQDVPKGAVRRAVQEAARLDGASELRICFTIILPLSTPVLASVGFLDFINRWNNWYTSQIYITKPELRSLQYLLKLILDNLDELKSMQQEGRSGSESCRSAGQSGVGALRHGGRGGRPDDADIPLLPEVFCQGHDDRRGQRLRRAVPAATPLRALKPDSAPLGGGSSLVVGACRCVQAVTRLDRP